MSGMHSAESSVYNGILDAFYMKMVRFVER